MTNNIKTANNSTSNVEMPPYNMIEEVMDEYGYPSGYLLPILNIKPEFYKDTNPIPYESPSRCGQSVNYYNSLAEYLAYEGDEFHYQSGQASYPTLDTLEKIIDSEWFGYQQEELSSHTPKKSPKKSPKKEKMLTVVEKDMLIKKRMKKKMLDKRENSNRKRKKQLFQ